MSIYDFNVGFIFNVRRGHYTFVIGMKLHIKSDDAGEIFSTILG
jgi:hypothetical protein